MKCVDNIYDKIKEMFGVDDSSLSILEEQIDTEVQTEYYEMSKNYEELESSEEIIKNKDVIFDKNASLDEKKSVLVQLASIDDIEAYRTIEKYIHQPNIKLYEWACLALQESKMVIESNLLDENKVLITTGLGGKGFKLRYFVVLFSEDGSNLTSFQQKTISDELLFSFRNANCELEEIKFEDNLAIILSVIPMQVLVQDLFSDIVDECNLLGNFLNTNYIITNLKTLTTDEIHEILAESNIE